MPGLAFWKRNFLEVRPTFSRVSYNILMKSLFHDVPKDEMYYLRTYRLCMYIYIHNYVHRLIYLHAYNFLPHVARTLNDAILIGSRWNFAVRFVRCAEEWRWLNFRADFDEILSCKSEDASFRCYTRELYMRRKMEVKLISDRKHSALWKKWRSDFSSIETWFPDAIHDDATEFFKWFHASSLRRG